MNKIGLTSKEKAFQADHVWPHIQYVGMFIIRIIEELHVRLIKHDFSKLSRPEVKMFADAAERLQAAGGKTFAYRRASGEMGKALDVHYSNNRHHPEHHPNGIDDMTLVDLVEMLCDWKAVTLGGEIDMEQFLEDAQKRFKLEPQTYNILANTIQHHFGEDQ